MQIDKINPTAFQAKFIHTDDLKNVVEYAVKHNKFDKLNESRKNIDKAYLQHRIRFELSQYPDGRPYVIFTRYAPKKNAKIIRTEEDYIKSEPLIYESSKVMNPLKYGLLKLIKLGNNAPYNRMYEKVVIRGESLSTKYKRNFNT